MVNYVVVTGGVISSVGKGIFTASLGMLLETHGYKITTMKVDPYLNIDAGTMRPTEHGEVYVTDDGFETDQDLGNYERFIDDLQTTKYHSVTNGQIYKKILDAEREGKYGGKCVDPIPAVPLEIIRRIRQVSNLSEADIVLIEIGGTAGEYQIFPFLDAIRRMKFSGDNVVNIHLGYLPIPNKVGEQKTKPLQRSIMDLNSCGINPEFVVGRSEKAMDEERKNKIALNCNIKKENVISAQDVEVLYEIPVNFYEQQLDKLVLKELGLEIKDNSENFNKWKEKVERVKNLKEDLIVGIVGKYFDIGDFSLKDSYISVLEAVKHAAYHYNRKPVIKWIDSKEFEVDESKLNFLKEIDCLIIPGGFGSSGVEGKIKAIKYARENKIPFLGLCYGLQLAVVEYARNVCGLEDAHTTEIKPHCKNPVVSMIPEQEINLKNAKFGGTMRLGSYDALLKKGTKVFSLYDKDLIKERHRHRWEVTKKYENLLEEKGLVLSGKNPDMDLVEFIELYPETHPYFVATQAHPEFKSKFMKPSPLFLGLIKAGIDLKSRDTENLSFFDNGNSS